MGGGGWRWQGLMTVKQINEYNVSEMILIKKEKGIM